MVAGYEIMSEPRVEENEVDPEVVRDFFAEACRTVHQADPATPCVVGPAPFYHAAHLDRVYLRSNTNVIYVFNFFIPKAFVSGDDRKLRYPGMMRCCDVHDKATRYQQGSAATILRAHRRIAATERYGPEPSTRRSRRPSRGRTRATCRSLSPVGVASSAGEGRLGYARDMMRAMRRHHLSWAYWQWRHRDDRPFAVVHLGYHGATRDDALMASSPRAGKRRRGVRCYARYPDLLAGFAAVTSTRASGAASTTTGASTATQRAACTAATTRRRRRRSPRTRSPRNGSRRRRARGPPGSRTCAPAARPSGALSTTATATTAAARLWRWKRASRRASTRAACTTRRPRFAT